METRQLSEEELEDFLANLGITDSLKSEVSQILPPPPLPDNLVVETPTPNKKLLLWVMLGVFFAFVIGFCLGMLLSPQNTKFHKLQSQIDSLSEKISSYEELTKPKYELIEPLASPSPFDSAA